MGRKKKKIIENITITGVAEKGKGVGRDVDGRVIFIDRGIPGDVVDVLIYKRRGAYYQGRIINIVSFSEDRIEAPCKHFGICGGCTWQNLAYSKQLEHKQLVVENALMRIAKVGDTPILPILPSEKEMHYRNKLQFTFSNKRWLTKEELTSGVPNKENVLGFHCPGAFDKIVNIDKCYLQEEPSNLLRNTIKEIALEQDLAFFDIREKKGFFRDVTFRITTLGEIMLIFSIYENDPEKFNPFFDELMKRFPNITSLYYCINAKLNDFTMDLDMVLYHGKAFVEEMLGKVKFRIGPKSFFQTNTSQAVRLFDVVADFAELSGEENVYDLYTGLGSIGLYVADKCKQVVGIEEIESAIEDAKINAELNNINNAVFYAGHVRKILTDEFAKQHGKPDLVITDPPRVGMHQDVVNMLLELAAPKIVYVSCNPATQARDIGLLKEKYDLLKIQPVDMFPHTPHIESVALLVLKK